MALFERADSTSKVTWVSILGLILVPVIIAAGFVFATWNASDRLGHVKAAVVNNDEGTKLNGKQVPLGRQLAAGLVDGDEDTDNYDWVLSDNDDAKRGLKDGEYVAVITIPKDFSKAVTSTAKDDPAKAVQATISATTSKVSPLSDAAISTAISTAARGTFNEEYTKQYLDGIYVGFNKLGDQFGELSDGANKLNNGASDLQDGTSGLADGTRTLNSGVQQLDAGGSQLNSGAGQLASGASSLAKGLNQLDKGASALPKQTRQLADGAQKTADGVAQYTKQTDTIITQSAQSASDPGLDQLKQGAAGVEKGTKGVSDGLSIYKARLDKQAAAITKIVKSGSPSPLATAANTKVDGRNLLTQSQADQIKAGLCTSDVDAATCVKLQAVYLQGLASGLGGASTGLVTGTDDTEATSLIGGAKQTATGADQLNTGVAKAVDGIKKGSEQLAKNKDALLKGSKQLRSGTQQVADGTDKLADGMGPLAKGIGQSADGADQLAVGASGLSTGVTTYTGGVHKLSSGTDELASGAKKLDDGTAKYADGTAKYADGVSKGKDQIPTYSKSDRQKMSEAVSSPIANNVKGLSGISLASSIALLLILALWVGALITYMVVRAVSSRALTSQKSSLGLMWRGLLPGYVISLVQAVVLAALSQLILKLDAGDFVTVMGFAAFAGIVFTTVNYALTAWFGGVGRFISVILLVLGIAAKVLSAVPTWLSGLAGFSPLTPAMDGITGIATGTGGAGHAAGVLFLWLLVAAGASVAAVARRRSLKGAELSRLARS